MKNLSSNNGKKLLIVESPTKSKKISSILGKDYKVLATFGHIRDLPEKHMGFSLNDIISGEVKITWEIIKQKVVNLLKKEVKNSSEVIIATDPDREGEAIAWHVVSVLGLKDVKRVVFHEITKKAVLSALNSPRKIDMNLVSAQITRRLIDRVVGYTLSPVFFSIRKNSSAGRVQSAALHLIVKRWKEVKDFVRKPYFIVFVDFGKVNALLYEKYEENGINRARVKHFLSEQEAKEICEKVNELIVSSFRRGKDVKYPLPPYTTSSLLQDSKNILGFSSDFTMRLAQELFERGLITYHRTDSVSLSEEGENIAKEFLSKYFQDIENAGRKWKTKVANAQEAHEAIRPTEEGIKIFERLFYNIKSLKQIRQSNLPPYDKLLMLISFRFLASQSKNAIFDTVEVIFKSPQLPDKFFFKVKAKKLKEEGFLKLWNYEIKEEREEEYEGEDAFSFLLSFEFKNKILVSPERKYPKISYRKEFTNPPPLYTEASLIKELERLGIGRPSTYSTIIKTLKSRGYIFEQNGKLIPTEDGLFQDEILEKYFPKICSPEFTAKMEEELDIISRGEKFWKQSLAEMTKKYLEEFEKFKEKVKEHIQSLNLTKNQINQNFNYDSRKKKKIRQKTQK
jgi:DNA topoisomerase-1